MVAYRLPGSCLSFLRFTIVNKKPTRGTKRSPHAAHDARSACKCDRKAQAVSRLSRFPRLSPPARLSPLPPISTFLPGMSFLERAVRASCECISITGLSFLGVSSRQRGVASLTPARGGLSVACRPSCAGGRQAEAYRRHSGTVGGGGRTYSKGPVARRKYTARPAELPGSIPSACYRSTRRGRGGALRVGERA